MNKETTFFGGIVGLITFLILGLLPSLVYSGFAGVILANNIYRASDVFLFKATIVFGIIVGTLAAASLFVIGGAVIGTGVGALLFTEAGNKQEKTNSA